MTSEWLFDQRIYRGSTVTLSGHGSGGKSTVATGLAVSLASGKKVIPGWTPTRVAPVLILDWEEDETTTQVRVAGICGGIGITVASLGDKLSYSRRTSFILDHREGIEKTVSEHKIELLIVQTFDQASLGHARRQTTRTLAFLESLGTTNLLIQWDDYARLPWAYGISSVQEGAGRRTVSLRTVRPRRGGSAQVLDILFSPSEPDQTKTYDSIRFALGEAPTGRQ